MCSRDQRGIHRLEDSFEPKGQPRQCCHDNKDAGDKNKSHRTKILTHRGKHEMNTQEQNSGVLEHRYEKPIADLE